MPDNDLALLPVGVAIIDSADRHWQVVEGGNLAEVDYHCVDCIETLTFDEWAGLGRTYKIDTVPASALPGILASYREQIASALEAHRDQTRDGGTRRTSGFARAAAYVRTMNPKETP